MTQETKYTVLARKDGSDLLFFVENASPERPQTIPGLIDYVISKGATPVAWSDEWTKRSGGAKHKDELLAESIAAGRTIEKIDGKYVARGIPEEKSLVAIVNECRELAAAMVDAGYAMECDGEEPKREPLTWAKPTKFDPFAGWKVYSDPVSSGFVESKPEQRHPLQSSPDLAVDRIPFGSAHLLKG